ncbi:MAG: CoA pyrophosphatase [Alphaproteobacteria bacterium]|nr:MAG: CoA pyrophosphatase [Alphaproteobacteria bacterium]
MMTERLKAHIRQRLAAPPAEGTVHLEGDHAIDPAWQKVPPHKSPVRDAAVLVPIVDRAEGLSVLLTRRADHLPSHAGQVSFPGGSVEPQDATPIETALRETEEEIGLDRSFVSVWGTLERYQTGTNFSILPVVGLVTTGFELSADPNEVAATFEVPFDFLMDPGNHTRKSAVWQGRQRIYYEMPYGEFYIWGATAGMLVNLYNRLYG